MELFLWHSSALSGQTDMPSHLPRKPHNVLSSSNPNHVILKQCARWRLPQKAQRVLPPHTESTTGGLPTTLSWPQSPVWGYFMWCSSPAFQTCCLSPPVYNGLCSLPDELPFPNTILQEISLLVVTWVFAITNIEHCIRPVTFVLIVRYIDRSLSSICFCIVYTLRSCLSPRWDFLPPLHCPVHH